MGAYSAVNFNDKADRATLSTDCRMGHSRREAGQGLAGHPDGLSDKTLALCEDVEHTL